MLPRQAALTIKAIDEVRAGEAPAPEGRWLRAGAETFALVPAEESGPPHAEADGEAQGALKYTLQTVRAFLQREDLQRFWEYKSPTWAGKFLDEWCTRVMRSKIKPMKKVARTLRNHRELILNWFAARARFSWASWRE